MNARVLGTPDAISSRSPQAQQATLDGPGNINQFKIEVGQKLTAMLLALSIMVNLACFWWLFTAERETRLKEYDLKSFQAEDFAPVSAHVENMQKEIDALKIQLALRQELRR